ncbi:MAG TPA: CdaR family protein [Candidatus Limnocylindrales bacterium]|nr:CdaR family protein [Candidatus Limnocylindrales bacterium]
MTRVLRVIVHNWPLKLAAIGLATLLYGGLVLSQSTATLTGVVPVAVRDQPNDIVNLTTIRPVTEVRYFSPSGVKPITSDFEAWVDLSDVTPGIGPQSVPVQLRSIDPRVTVVGFDPQAVTIDLDRLGHRSVPVEVVRGSTPEGLELGSVTIQPQVVDVRGPATVITRVVAARANVVIQPSGIDVDQDVDLVPVDAVGDQVPQVQLEPATARITIPVFSNRQSKSLPITPLISGTPAAGFEISSATVVPSIVTVEGDIDQLDPLTSIDTAPISVAGFSSSQTVEATLAVPTGLVALDAQTVQVSITVRSVTATRTFTVGLRLVGARADRTYATSTDRILITVGGGLADLDRLSGEDLLADLQVGGLVPGTAAVPVTVELPPGLTLAVANPPQIDVTVALSPAVSATPPSPVPSAAPSAGG